MSPFALVSAAFAAAAVLALMAYILSQTSAEGDVVSERLTRYGGSSSPEVDPIPDDASRSASLRAALDSVTTPLGKLLPRGNHGKLADDLARADLRLKPMEWLLIVAGICGALGFLGWMRFQTPIAFIAGIVGGWFASGFYLRFLQHRRSRVFDRQLSGTITLLSNALKAGLSFSQALATVSKNGPPPICEEFARCTKEMSLGIGVEEALNHMVERSESEDFDLLVTAVQIQRVVGGNLAEILDKIAFTIRERVRITGEIRTLTTQARFSGYIITLLPVGLCFILAAISPTYFGPMLSTGLGHTMLLIGVISIGIGSAIIRKVVRIEV